MSERPRGHARRWRPDGLAIWFGVIALVGLLRFAMRASSGDLEDDAVAWIWLAGGVAAGVVSLASFVHARRARRRSP